MESNQAKIKEASSLLKDIDEHNYDFDKKLELINKANSLIAAVNSSLNPESQQNNNATLRSTAAPSIKTNVDRKTELNSRSKIVYQDNKITATLPNNNDHHKDPVKIDVSQENHQNAVNKSSQRITEKRKNNVSSNSAAGEVHMSRKQYREMLKRQGKD